MNRTDLARIVLALHGAPFSMDFDPFTSRDGEPVKLPKSETPVYPEVTVLVERCCEAAGAWAASPQINELKQLWAKTIFPIASEVMRLDDRSFGAFERTVAKAVMDNIIRHLESVPRFEDVNSAPDPLNKLGRIDASLAQVAQCFTLLNFLGEALKERGERLDNLRKNLDHDVLGHFTSLRVPVSYFVESARFTARAQHLRFPLNDTAPFLVSLVRGMRAIALDSYEIGSCDATRLLLMAASHSAHRFKYTLTCNDQVIFTSSEGHSDRVISIRVDPNVTLLGDGDAIGLVLYNLIKNPIKLAYFAGALYPSVDIECRPSSDQQSTSIYVRDNGMGVSYDTLKDTFTQRARAREQTGSPLSLVDRCLLSEPWAPHVPPVALNQLLLDRGASVGGGTGIGLSLAHSIITEGHQGWIQIYDHPDHGAGVQVLLPHVGPEFGVEQRLRITRRSLEHQLAKALAPESVSAGPTRSFPPIPLHTDPLDTSD
jgi:signal transduction histidine kinase